jgi:chaperonin cofactor prefoldin
MSFFIGPPAAESTSNVFNDTRNENQIEADEKFNELLLDQDDFFLDKPLETKTSRTIFSHSSEDEGQDTGDLEIVGIQETEQLSKPTRIESSATYPTKVTALRARTMTNRPTKYRKIDSSSISKPSIANMDKLVEQQLLAALSTQMSEIQRLQAQLSSYIKKYDQSKFQLSNTLERLKELQKKVDHQKLLQSEMGQEFSKLSEIKTGYADQIQALKAEREELRKQIDTLNNEISHAQSSYKKLNEKFCNVSHKIKTGNSHVNPLFFL